MAVTLVSESAVQRTHSILIDCSDLLILLPECFLFKYSVILSLRKCFTLKCYDPVTPNGVKNIVSLYSRMPYI